MTYKLTVYFKGLFGGKKEYEVVGNYYPPDVPGFMILSFADHSIELINLSSIKRFNVSKELYFLKLDQNGANTK